MASGMYTFGVSEILKGNIDLVNDDISAVLLSTVYSPVLATDQYQSDIPDAAILDEVQLESTEVNDAAFDADAATFTDVDSDSTATGIAIVKDTGDYSTSVLIAYVDITPFTTDGTSVVINWHTDGIFEF